jgi:hypothetical protein
MLPGAGTHQNRLSAWRELNRSRDPDKTRSGIEHSPPFTSAAPRMHCHGRAALRALRLQGPMASEPPSAGETLRLLGGSGSLLGALTPPAAVAGDCETFRLLGGSGSLLGVIAAVASTPRTRAREGRTRARRRPHITTGRPSETPDPPRPGPARPGPTRPGPARPGPSQLTAAQHSPGPASAGGGSVRGGRMGLQRGRGCGHGR